MLVQHWLRWNGTQGYLYNIVSKVEKGVFGGFTWLNKGQWITNCNDHDNWEVGI